MNAQPTPADHSFVIELFAGPGGMSEGLKLAGISPALTIGIEIDKDACDTAEKAGHPRLQADVTDLHPVVVADRFGWPTGIHGSPPCQGFSMAGKGVGRKDTAVILEAIERMGYGEHPAEVLRWLRTVAQDDKSALCLEPLHWALALRPEWISMEQVPAVLPLWEAIAKVLTSHGYSVWTGHVNAEQFGVPQTRKRAILLASRVRTVSAPVPTHSKFHSRTPTKLDPGVQKWVSMAEALGWGMVKRPYPTVAAGTKSGGADPQMLGGSGARAIVAREREAGEGHWVEKQVGFPRKYDGGAGGVVEIDGEDYRARDLRSEHHPSFTVTEKARSWNVYDVEHIAEAGIDRPALRNNTSEKAGVRDITEPAPTMYFGARLNKMVWEESEREPVHPTLPCGCQWADHQKTCEAASPRGWVPARLDHVPPLQTEAIWQLNDRDRKAAEQHPEHGPVKLLGAGLHNQQGQRARDPKEPSHTITGKGTACWRYEIDPEKVAEVTRERLNNQSGTDFDLEWPAHRPAQVVAGRGLNTAPGANGNRFNGSKKSRNDGVRVTVEEAGTLQSFPENYPWQGVKTSQFQQVGNAVPPLLGFALVRPLIGDL